VSEKAPAGGRTRRSTGGTGSGTARKADHEAGLDADGLRRYQALKAWRAEVAREHNLPAYVIFQNATLAAVAQDDPRDLDALASIPGMGEKKLAAYGDEVLRVSASA